MAIYCPIYDPTYGWYIIVCGPGGSYKKKIPSPLYYYHSMGVKPPVGAKFTPEDYLDFDMDLEDAEMTNSSGIAPLSFAPISSFATPLSTNSFQAAATSTSGINPSSISKAPLVIPSLGTPSPSTSSAASSSGVFSKRAAILKALNKSMDVMDSLLLSSSYGGQSGSSLTLPTSPYTSLLAKPNSNSPLKSPYSLSHLFSNPSTFSNLSSHLNTLPSTSSGYGKSQPKHSSTLSYLYPLPSTSSNLSHQLHSPSSTSSGYSNVLPPTNSQCPVHAAAATSSSNTTSYPALSADYDESMAYDMHLHDIEETAMDDDDYNF